jgi:hypothetical protein
VQSNRYPRFIATFCLHAANEYQVFLRSVRRLLVMANVVPSSPILVTLMKEALSSSEMLVLTRATWHNIPEDGILHSHCSENLKSTIILLVALYGCIYQPLTLKEHRLRTHENGVLQCTYE